MDTILVFFVYMFLLNTQRDQMFGLLVTAARPLASNYSAFKEYAENGS